jgi:hypothetical protein
MHMRHIRPGSVDWFDATLEDGARGLDPLSPEEKTRLREIGEAEQQVSMKALGNGANGRQPGLTRSLF